MQRQTLKFLLPISIFLAILGIAMSLDGWRNGAVANVLPQPAPPTRFFGRATIEDQDVPSGTVLSASIGTTISVSTSITLYNGQLGYGIDIPGDNPATSVVEGAHEGDEILFKIPGYTATQRGIWHFGTTTPLDLIMIPNPTPLPTPTLVTPTPIPPRKPVTIPEPVTVVLFGAGLTVLSAFRAFSQRKRE